MSSSDTYCKLPSPLPDIPKNSDKEEVKKMLMEYALCHNFILTVCQSSAKLLHLKCKKGGSYKNWRRLNKEDRRRHKKSGRTGCPFYIRLSNKKGLGFQYLSPRVDRERFHNHLIDERNSFDTSAGRKSKLTVDDLKKVTEGIEKNLPTKTILKSISSDGFCKLTIHDINNKKYAAKKQTTLRSVTFM
ncbi:hypothetical protein BY458DRAFT_488769 [Sporodiniella umbellata]|nr:hypothetical protein BY458DRAFT_488769 [Sporodiniella umbellata]